MYKLERERSQSGDSSCIGAANDSIIFVTPPTTIEDDFNHALDLQSQLESLDEELISINNTCEKHTKVSNTELRVSTQHIDIDLQSTHQGVRTTMEHAHNVELEQIKRRHKERMRTLSDKHNEEIKVTRQEHYNLKAQFANEDV
jgi:hypothetical protein